MNPSLFHRIIHKLRAIPDYPTPGVIFRDITPVLADPALLAAVVADMEAPFRASGITHVAGIEARGFILGAPIALAVGAGFVPVRKSGKLPWKSVRREYELEYGSAALEAHQDAFHRSARVLIVDDVLATGGTAAAAAGLVRELGGEVVGWTFLLEIDGLGGRARLEGAPIHVSAAV